MPRLGARYVSLSRYSTIIYLFTECPRTGDSHAMESLDYVLATGGFDLLVSHAFDPVLGQFKLIFQGVHILLGGDLQFYLAHRFHRRPISHFSRQSWVSPYGRPASTRSTNCDYDDHGHGFRLRGVDMEDIEKA